MTQRKPDEELMRDYVGGDSSAFDELYRRHSTKVYGYLRKRINNPQEAEELYQAVFLKFHRTKERFDFKHEVTQWLFVITRTTLIDYFRHRAIQPAQTDGVNASDKLIEEIADQSSVNNEVPSFDTDRLKGLSEKHQSVVKLRIMDDLSYAEIAQKLKTTEQNIRQIFSRAIRKLRSQT